MIGIYGGTFDPIHLGHLSLAIDMMEKRQLEEIWFCPVGISPHKRDQPPTTVHHRLEMLQKALEGIPYFRILDIETKRQGPSYTIDTLYHVLGEEAKQTHSRNFCLILGDDAVPSFCRWHQPEEIVKLVPIFIGRRLQKPLDFKEIEGDPAILSLLAQGMTDTKMMEISGTEIRKRLAAGLYCGHLLPGKVLDYIYANKLYLSL